MGIFILCLIELRVGNFDDVCSVGNGFFESVINCNGSWPSFFRCPKEVDEL
jgi:hypothetical protein